MKGLEITIGMFVMIGAGTYSFVTGVDMLAANAYVYNEDPRLLIAVGSVLILVAPLLCIARGRKM